MIPHKQAWPKLGDILHSHNEVDSKYTLTPKLWDYLQAYRAKHACFNMSETYDRLGLKHLQVPCIPTNTGGVATLVGLHLLPFP